jgi:pimeloyl-ACP methyl ester carboxylesterase
VTDPIPGATAAALAAPGPAGESTVEVAGIPFHALRWGMPDAPPVLLVHGVTASAAGWWRVGPAIAAAGNHVVAPDLPGHGLTGHWTGHVRFRDNAADLAAFARAALPTAAASDVRVVGHSWGAMTVAALPAAGYVPARLVLIDPPAIPLDVIALLLDDPAERRYEDVAQAVAVIGPANPTWAYGDVAAKAEGLTQFDDAAVRSILLENGDWDGGLSALAHPAARFVPGRLVRGDPAFGGYVPDEALPAFEARLGPQHVATIAGAPHSPHRTHPVETVAAILRFLGD